MCIGSNSVNQAQDLISVTKLEDFPNSLLPTIYTHSISASHHGTHGGSFTNAALNCLMMKIT